MSTSTLSSELFLPEPEPRAQIATIISVDDHFVEPPDTFHDRMPLDLREFAPRVEELPSGQQVWCFDGRTITEIGLSAVAGRRPETIRRDAFRFEDMRPGCYDPDARVADMDINGIWASLNFPSTITGFCGRVLSNCSRPDVGKAATRAWNDWQFEEWYLPHPDRFILNGITYLTDPEFGATEIRRNADRGFRSVTFPERPQRIGLPSLFSGYWDPLVEACVETGTVINLHVGSTGTLELPDDGPLIELNASLFSGMSMMACVEWLWSPYPRRHPDLRIALSEGGIGWVAMLVDRLEKIRTRYASDWTTPPVDVLRRNFSFCTIDDASTIDTRDVIGIENIMLEVDYPHIDGTWPNTQIIVREMMGHLPADELRAICCENAARLYNHPLPAQVLPARHT